MNRNIIMHGHLRLRRPQKLLIFSSFMSEMPLKLFTFICIWWGEALPTFTWPINAVGH